MKLYKLIVLLLCLVPLLGLSQESKVDMNYEGKEFTQLKHAWTGQWITHPTASTMDYGVFVFRKQFELTTVPEIYEIHVSADNKYKLYVNGKYVCFGPSRGDINNWRYETVDIARYLRNGKNVIAAEVINYGEFRHGAQQTFQTAFIVQSDLKKSPVIYTSKNSGWKVSKNMAYHVIPFVSDSVGGYYCAGPGEHIDAKLYPWGWQEIDYDDSEWVAARSATVEFAVGRGFLFGSTWYLVPRTIPMMKEERTDFKYVIQQENIQINKQLTKNSFPIRIPANTKVKFVMDHTTHTVGYPKLKISKGKDSKLKLTYAEAQFYKSSSEHSAHGGWKKGHRQELEDKEVRGYYDIIVSDGGIDREYQPLSMRTFRFVAFDIETADEPLTIDGFYNVYTAYPFEVKGKFESDNPELTEIWNASWRTLKNSSHDVFLDPYYEQLQYVGDARIESMVSLYMTGDDRLMRKAIRSFDDSRLPNGLTQSRFPSYIVQVIPTYSLLWIGMMHDYYMYRDDPEYLKQFLPGIETVLQFFINKIDDTGMPKGMEWWNFTDWTSGFQNGIPPGADDGHSANVSLQLVKAMQDAAVLYKHFGKIDKANYYNTQAHKLSKVVMTQCYDETKKLISERPEKDVFSQHTNIFAVLTNTIPQEQQSEMMTRVLTDGDLIKASIYFKYYLFRALQKTGLGNEYHNQLEPWKYMLSQGMTTFGETDKNPRSECHAWSATPCLDYNHIIAGIYPTSPGFNDIIIEPNLGNLEYIKGAIPHPKGIITYEFRKSKKKLKGFVQLPKGVKGTFKYGDEKCKVEGKQKINVKL